MKATYKAKTLMIYLIDKLNDNLSGTLYERELKMLRAKYIYKDISKNEFISDYKNICCYKDIIKMNKKSI